MDPKTVGFRRAVARFASRIGLGPAFRRAGVSPITGNICISMVKNEQDIIEPFIRHNMKFFDAMIVLDNGSTDGTRAILTQLSRELGTVFVTDFPDKAFNQSQTMTAALHFAQGAFFADYFCFLDADEFIGAASRASFDSALAGIRVGHCGLMAWQTFLPDPDAVREMPGDPLACMTWRRKVEQPGYSKVVLRMGGKVAPGLVVKQGCHAVLSAQGQKLPSHPLDDVPLLHLPIRSSSQLIAKGLVGWMANASRDPATYAGRQSFQKKRIHDRVTQGKTSFSPRDLAYEAMIYAQQAEDDGDFDRKWRENAIPAQHGIDLTRRHSDGSVEDHDVLVAAARDPKPMRSQGFELPAPRNRNSGWTGIENAFHGAWRWEFLVLDQAPFRLLAERHQPASVMDIGCGNGAVLAVFRSCGASKVFGVDGIDGDATVLGSDEYQTADLQVPFDAGFKFDLVTCLEVIEHLRPEATAVALDTIERHARDMIVISVAEPGQPGNGHINCRQIEEILGLWAARGWQPDLIETLAIRALSTMSWFRRNIVVLRRTGETGQTEAARRLCAIGAREYTWYGQKPGLRLAAFVEAYPELGKAYH